MKIFNSPICRTAVMFSALALAACGGDDGGGGEGAPNALAFSGKTTPAAIDGSNAESLGRASSEGVRRAVETTKANESNPFAFGVSAVVTPTAETAREVSERTRTIVDAMPGVILPTGVVLGANAFGDDPEYCGGSVTAPDDFGANDTLNGALTFSNLCFDGFTMNGTVAFTETASSITIAYRNLTVSDGSTAQTLNTSVTCTTDFLNCTSVTDFTSAEADGEVLRVSDLSVSGSDTSGYTVDATFFHPEHGSVGITTPQPVLFDCADGRPSTGLVRYEGVNGSSGSISFNSCTSYTISYDDGSGVTQTLSGTWI